MKRLAGVRLMVRVCFVFCLISGLLYSSPVAAAETIDHAVFGDMLGKYVKNGRVDYAGFKADQAKLEQYLSYLEKIDPETLSRNEQFAFYINVTTHGPSSWF